MNISKLTYKDILDMTEDEIIRLRSKITDEEFLKIIHGAPKMDESEAKSVDVGRYSKDTGRLVYDPNEKEDAFIYPDGENSEFCEINLISKGRS